MGIAALRAARAVRDPPGRGATRLVIPCLAAGTACGSLIGSTAGHAARSACTAGLSTGEAVDVAAVLAASVTPSEGRARLTLVAAHVRAGGRSCRVPRLTAYVTGVGQRQKTGAQLRLRGEWIRSRHASRRWPSPVHGYGFVTGRLSEPRLASADRTGPFLGARGWASGRLGSRLPPDVEPLARALTLAERDDLPGSLRRRFAEAGLAHLLAISGLHVGLIAAALTWLSRLFLGRRCAYAVAACLVILYVVAIGASPSAQRAAVLVAGWAAARTLGRPLRILDLLGAAAIVALLLDPLSVLGPSFQLSFAGFFGLLLGSELARRHPVDRTEGRGRRPITLRLARKTWPALGASAGAFALTAPVAAAHFQHVAPIAVVSHFVGTPLIGLTIAALAGTLLLPAGPGALAASATAALLRLLQRAVEFFASLPLGHGSVAPPGPAAWAAFALFLVVLVRWASGRAGSRSLLLLSSGGCLLLGGPALASLLGGRAALLCTLDVGQGDAAVVRTRRGGWIVLDAGPAFGRRDAGRDVLVPRLRRGGARSVELFILSHPDLDHLGGAGALLQHYPVRRVLEGGVPLPKPAYERFLGRIEEQGLTWMRGREGDRVRIDEIAITVLGPPKASLGSVPISGAAREANESSLSVRVVISGGFAYVNTGDATTAEERRLVSAWPAESLRADVLKVGHHGSRSSSSLEWLEAVAPAIAVISAGTGNAYGHPHEATLARLGVADVPRVWRTDRNGTLCIQVGRNGEWRVEGERFWRRPASAERASLTGETAAE